VWKLLLEKKSKGSRGSPWGGWLPNDTSDREGKGRGEPGWLVESQRKKKKVCVFNRGKQSFPRKKKICRKRHVQKKKRSGGSIKGKESVQAAFLHLNESPAMTTGRKKKTIKKKG